MFELRLIAEFMGAKFFEIISETDREKKLYGDQYWKCSFTPENDKTWVTPSALLYKEYWNWITPVILQICRKKQFQYKLKYIKHTNKWVASIYHEIKEFCDEEGSDSPIESSYKAVVLFLKWLENVVEPLSQQQENKETVQVLITSWEPDYMGGGEWESKCGNCESIIENNYKFCPYCGNEFKEKIKWKEWNQRKSNI